ncbi:hypothetical protein [Providencia rustigianii]|uniref:hypothetical protein n=1 Tax=Providencia rustigianii TaxID=158850 RepID=UPI00300FD994
MAIAGATAATLTSAGYPLGYVLAAALAAGALCGLWNGFWWRYCRYNRLLPR